MSVLVIAEHDNAELKPATLNTVAAAAQLGDVDILVAGENCNADASALRTLPTPAIFAAVFATALQFSPATRMSTSPN